MPAITLARAPNRSLYSRARAIFLYARSLGAAKKNRRATEHPPREPIRITSASPANQRPSGFRFAPGRPFSPRPLDPSRRKENGEKEKRERQARAHDKRNLRATGCYIYSQSTHAVLIIPATLSGTAPYVRENGEQAPRRLSPESRSDKSQIDDQISYKVSQHEIPCLRGLHDAV